MAAYGCWRKWSADVPGECGPRCRSQVRSTALYAIVSIRRLCIYEACLHQLFSASDELGSFKRLSSSKQGSRCATRWQDESGEQQTRVRRWMSGRKRQRLLGPWHPSPTLIYAISNSGIYSASATFASSLPAYFFLSSPTSFLSLLWATLSSEARHRP